jgi:energy-converting hydrogenase Eha subunit H
MQVRNHRLQASRVFDRVNFAEPFLKHRNAAGIHPGLVHAGAVVITNDLFGASLVCALVGLQSVQNPF